MADSGIFVDFLSEMIYNALKRLNGERKIAEKTALHFGTTVHKDVTDRLIHINPGLAAQARVVLDINKAERHIRGGLATKEKYEHRLQACSQEKN